MARTEYRDPEAEKAYQKITDESSKPSAEDQEYEQEAEQYNKNNMLRNMSVRSTLGKIQRDNKARY